MKMWTLLVAFLFLPSAALAQDTVRKLEGPGQHSKFLTPNQLDRWLFSGEKGETIIAYVSTKEFDPVLELAVKGDKDEKVLIDVDDEGSESRFAMRLPETGEYSIRVHAFKYQGGGNYVLQVRRFQAQPLQVGKPALGAFDREGRSHHYFQGTKGQILIPDLRGTAPDSWRMLDVKGREMKHWAGAVTIEDDGEHSLVLTGRPDNRYDLLVREATNRDLEVGKDGTGRPGQGEMEVWNFEGKPGDFRLLEVEKKGELAAQLIYAPRTKSKVPRLPRRDALPELQFLPVASRGGHLRFAVLLGREGRYQLQLLARTSTSYTLRMADPSVPIDRDRPAEGNLPVAGTGFYSFKAAPGQLVQATLSSQKFVPLLRLYDFRGNLVEQSDDNADGLEGRVTHMIKREGLYRLQVSSLGDGGSGEFRLALQDIKLKELEVGGRGKGMLQPNLTDYWTFQGKQGMTLIISARSAVSDPVVSIYSPDGVQLASDVNRGMGTDSLLSVKLPRTGRYTIWVSSRRGAGDYTLRLIDGD